MEERPDSNAEVALKTPLSRTELAYQVLHDLLKRGDIKPGEWLRQNKLAEELNVSTVTIREAFKRLVANGLAEYIPYKGIRAIALPVEELEVVYQIRGLLEGLALERAATRISQEDLARMRKLLPDTVVGEDPDSFIEAWDVNSEFHMIAIRASQSHHLERILKQVLDLTNPYAILNKLSLQARADSASWELEEHTQILESLESRDGNRARKLISEHLEKALEWLQARISE